jgi:hypothetical protein
MSYTPHATWRKSSRCTPNGGDCIEVGTGLPGDRSGIRDTTKECVAVLSLPTAQLLAFTAAIKDGQFA